MLPRSPKPLDQRRRYMIEHDLVGRGIADPRVLSAMRDVPRERFVSRGDEAHAYADRPLGIGRGQTISQPYIVAYMAELLDIGPDERVLEIGTGSGYAAAVLSELAAEVHTVERIPELAQLATDRLADRPNVQVHLADGRDGWPAGAPYDAILVSAAAPRLPEHLIAQLARGGRLVTPVGPPYGNQRLVLVRRAADDRLTQQDLGAVAFVPLVPDVGAR